MRRALPLVVLLALGLLPLASAQVPDPDAVVGQACALSGDARDLLPVCAQEEPAAPQEAAQEPHDHAAAAQGPADPAQDPAGAAQGLADQARETVEGAAADPASAPDRIVAFLATLLQIVKDLLSLPALGMRATLDGLTQMGEAVATIASAIGHGVADGASATGGAVADGFTKVGELASDAWTAVADLFAGGDAGSAVEGVDLPDAPKLDAPDAAGLLDRALGALPEA